MKRAHILLTRDVINLTVVLTTLIFLIGCSLVNQKQVISPPPQTDEIIKLKMITHRTDLVDNLMALYVTEFNNKYPHIEVEVEGIKDYQNHVRILMSVNELPDVWMVDSFYVTREELAEFNEPLDDLSFIGDLTAMHYFTGSDDQLYAVPTGLYPVSIVYNKTIFSELSLSIPTTLDEFFEICEIIKQAGKTPLATGAKNGWSSAYYTGSLLKLIADDANIMNELAEKDSPFQLEDPIGTTFKLIQTMSMRGYFEEEPLAASFEELKIQFRRGNIAMYLTGSWFVPQAISEGLPVDQIGLFAFPYHNNQEDTKLLISPDVGLGISKRSKHKEAAKTFITWWMTENYDQYLRDTAFMSTRASVLTPSPHVKKLLNSGHVQLQDARETGQYKEVTYRAGFDWFNLTQDVIKGNDLQELFAQLNASWNEAKSIR